jgi:hypothetical protein
MINTSFGHFVDKKKRDALKELELIERMLKRHGFQVENHLEDSDGEDPYIYCYNPSKEGSFEGIRIYKIADNLAFRVQKESQTHPYGRAYPLEIEKMYNDFLEDEDTSEDKAGKKVIEAVVKEIRKFFEKSTEVERDDRMSAFGTPGDKPGDGSGSIAIKTQGTDYSSLVHSKS